MSSTALRRVFWPLTAAKDRSSPGWIVGWMNSDNDYFVFAILNEESIKVNKVYD
jgi:beta-lactamase class D